MSFIPNEGRTEQSLSQPLSGLLNTERTLPESPRYFAASQQTLREIAQSLLEMRKMARSLENSASTLVVLADHPDVMKDLSTIEAHARLVDELVNRTYKLIAREAMNS
jgi:hypothetical protein